MRHLCFDFSFDGGLGFRAIASVIVVGSVKPCSARSEDGFKMDSVFEPRGLYPRSNLSGSNDSSFSFTLIYI